MKILYDVLQREKKMLSSSQNYSNSLSDIRLVPLVLGGILTLKLGNSYMKKYPWGGAPIQFIAL